MSVLRNPKHEIVAKALALGKTAEQASASPDAAGNPVYDPAASSFASNARKRAQRPDIRRRVDEIRATISDRADKDLGLCADYMLAKLRSYVDVNLDDYLSKPDQDGERHYTLANVPRELLGRLAGITLGRELTGRGKRRRLRTFVADVTPVSPLAAMTLGARLQGLLRDKVALTDPSGERPAHYIISERPLTEEEWERQRASTE
jgi:hypothetical protein